MARAQPGERGYPGGLPTPWVVIPAGRFDEAFFRQRTHIAGEIIQKFVNYRVGLAVIGDSSRHTGASSALRDFVRECNRGQQTWFLSDAEELHERLKS
ncbi:DUF4180 domain-containing protein [Streptomyces lydicus]|uniref:DUF4180 domain-containing protein n=1 Tax=Streptomyces lydicus TaxID=47763 RepID=UPI0036F9FCE1